MLHGRPRVRAGLSFLQSVGHAMERVLDSCEAVNNIMRRFSRDHDGDAQLPEAIRSEAASASHR
jgi:hypothetical protein